MVQHGTPADWEVREFRNETKAKVWLAKLRDVGYTVSTGAEWHYGYTYTITVTTRETIAAE
jgi:hypothetical protein